MLNSNDVIEFLSKVAGRDSKQGDYFLLDATEDKLATNSYIQKSGTAFGLKVKVIGLNNESSGYTLPIASSSVLGGIKVGSGLSINSTTGVLSATGVSAPIYPNKEIVFGDGFTAGGVTSTSLTYDGTTLYSAGQIGVGITSPTVRLSVQDQSNTQYVQFRLGNGELVYDFMFGRRPDNGTLEIQGQQVGYNDISLAPSSGYIGIGIGAGNRPSYMLDVNGDIRGQNLSGGGTQMVTADNNGKLGVQSIPSVTPSALTKTDDTNVTLALGGSPSVALLAATSLTLGWTGTLGVTRGGTNLSSIAQGDLLYGSALNTYSALTKSVTANQFLSNSGTSNNPAWATITASMIGSGAALTKTDDTNITLTLGGTPTTALLAATSLTLGWTGTLAYSRFVNGGGLSVVGRSVNSSGVQADITGTANQVLRVNSGGTSLAFGAIDISTSSITGILPLANGGTNTNLTAVAGAVAYSTTTAIALSASGTTGRALISGGTGSPTWYAPTAGSIIFAGTSGVLSQNNSNLFWDNTNGRLGIFTSAPTTYLNIVGANGMPSTSGSTSTDTTLRINNSSGGVTGGSLDMGNNGSSGSWLQSRNASNYATNWPLMLNPNGGSVNIGTTSGAYTLQVVYSTNSANSPQVVFTNNGTGNSSSMMVNAGSTGNPNIAWGVSSTQKANLSWNISNNYIGLANLVYSANNFSLLLNSSGSLIFQDGANASNATLFQVTSAGKVFIGGSTSPTAYLHLAAGTASANTSPLKFTSGTNLTTAEAGAMEYNGTNLFFTRTGTTRESVFVGVSGATAPTTNTIGVIVDYFGTSATRVLTTPNSWASVVISGTTYKIPLYS